MTAPEYVVQSVDGQDFGPDFTATPDAPPADSATSARTTRRRATKKQKPEDDSLLGKLGTNSPARSPIRQLTAEDRDIIASHYRKIARIAVYFRPQLGHALEMQSDECADGWMRWAAKNVKVRKQLLAVVEGSAVTEVMMAHLPILMAVVPEKFVEQFLLKGFGNLFQAAAMPNDDSDDYTSDQHNGYVTNYPPNMQG